MVVTLDVGVTPDVSNGFIYSPCKTVGRSNQNRGGFRGEGASGALAPLPES